MSDFARRWIAAIGLIIAFSLVLVVAGHGVAPVGYLMLFGWIGWRSAVLLAWIGIALIIVGPAVRSSHGASRLLPGLGALALFVAWCTFVANSESLAFSLLSSVPFGACLVSRYRRRMVSRP